jgi:hypothetical protein
LAALSAPAVKESPGEGWLTRAQISELTGLKRFATQQFLTRGIEKGTVETKKFYLKASNGSLQPIPHYRIVR